ncbi:SDR family NAD(P)-dependent oxidoreductase [Enterovibrio sp. Hal110]
MTGNTLNRLFDLTGHVALVTGAGSGIGQRMAFALSQAGAKVLLAGRHVETLSQTAALIAGSGGDSAVVVADLTRREMLPDVIANASSHFGAPDILVNAAGVNLREPAEDISIESWDKTINLNLSVPFFLGKACLPGMLEKGRGKIINIGSLQSYRAFANLDALRRVKRRCGAVNPRHGRSMVKPRCYHQRNRARLFPNTADRTRIHR